MAISILLEGTTFNTNPSSVKDLQSDANLLFNLEKKFLPFLDLPLSDVPDKSATTVTYGSPSAKLAPAGSSDVAFSLQGNTTGSLEVIRGGGELLSYSNGLTAPEPCSALVPSSRAYLRLTLKLNLSAKASGAYASGGYGVKASASAAESYAITFCKAFAPETKVRDAIQQTFESFVLPFTSKTLQSMQIGDFLFHEFDGRLNLAVGAYAGVDKVFYAGQGAVDVVKAMGSPLATLKAGIKPEAKGALSFDFKMQYDSRFEALLSRDDDASGSLHLFRSDKRSSTVSTGATLDISLNASAGVKEQVTDHLSDLKTSAVNAAGGKDAAAGKALDLVLSKAGSQIELQKYADECTDKLTAWLNKANGKCSNLEVAIENNHARTSLAGYTFDLSSTAFPAAWNAAIRCDMIGAINTGAATLAPGSGLESEYRRKTSCTCNVFNLWSVTSWDDFHEKTSMVYAGNNVFHLVADVGRSQATESSGTARSIDLYFSARADAELSGPVTHPDVSLHLDMKSLGDRKGFEKIAQMLKLIDGGASTAARDLLAFASNTRGGIAKLSVTVPGAAYARIASDPFSGPHDKVNWDAFAKAAHDLGAWGLINVAGVTTQTAEALQQYSAWQLVNKDQNGITAPNRLSFGDSGSWPDAWSAVPTGSRPGVTYSLWAGQHFMNFCAALQQLAAVQSTDGVSETWSDLLKTIETAIKKDVGVDFLPPTALAVIRLCQSGGYSLTAPLSTDVPSDHFNVTLSLG